MLAGSTIEQPVAGTVPVLMMEAKAVTGGPPRTPVRTFGRTAAYRTPPLPPPPRQKDLKVLAVGNGVWVVFSRPLAPPTVMMTSVPGMPLNDTASSMENA